MELIDTHTHLFTEQFNDDRAEVVQRAKEAGVGKFFIPHIDSSSTDQFYDLCTDFSDCCYPMMGLHPTSVKEDYKKELDHVFKQYEVVTEKVPHQRFFAVGEIGIDLYWDQSLLKEQQDAFEQQLLFAKDRQLPVIIHARNSFQELFEIVDKHNDENLTGIFHCFTGTVDDANHIIQYGGFKMGIGGVVTFKNSGLDKTLAQIPIEHIVLETDSPYLAPAPHRGKRNESAYVKLVAEKVAEVYQLPLEKVAEMTSGNALELFKLN